MDELGLLGPTEKIVADKLAGSVRDCLSAARQLVEDFEKAQDVDWGALILDSEHRKGALILLDPLEGLARNLGQARMIALITSVVATPKES